jgi:hypothetical protein
MNSLRPFGNFGRIFPEGHANLSQIFLLGKSYHRVGEKLRKEGKTEPKLDFLLAEICRMGCIAADY